MAIVFLLNLHFFFFSCLEMQEKEKQELSEAHVLCGWEWIQMLMRESLIY